MYMSKSCSLADGSYQDLSFFFTLCLAYPDEIVINTPSTLAQKYWITNGAVHAKHVVVFAQLIVGEAKHGIHGILVRIRDNDLKVNLAGIIVIEIYQWQYFVQL